MEGTTPDISLPNQDDVTRPNFDAAALPRLETPVLAVVIPCYNEEAALPPMLARLLPILDRLVADGLIAAESYIACVDDGSRDATWQGITEARERTGGRVKGLKLSRNFGHQNALIAGLFSFDYTAAVSIDADGQDPPELIAEMVAKYVREGCDIVYGVRDDRSSDSFGKRTNAQLYYRLMQAMKVEIVYNHADFRLLSRRVVQALAECGDYHLFLRGLIPFLGYQSAAVYYARAERSVGESKYPLHKQLALAWNGITAFSTLPLALITICGLLVFLAAAIALIALGIAHLAGHAAPLWAPLIAAQYLVIGLNILFLGVVGQYVGRIYQEVKRRPRFLVDQRLL